MIRAITARMAGAATMSARATISFHRRRQHSLGLPFIGGAARLGVDFAASPRGRGARSLTDTPSPDPIEGLDGAYSINISSWFCVPEHMPGEELLSRGSALILPWRGGEGTSSSEREYHVVTSAHVVHPFSFPHYYQSQMEWLQHVKEEHVTCLLELRSPSGDILATYPLRQRVHRHESRDIAALHAPSDYHLIEFLENYGKRTLTMAPAPEEGAPLFFVGHFRTGDEDDQPQRPCSIGGVLVGRGGPYTFGKTQKLLEMGMCGGPVVTPSGGCIGMTEAIVSPQGPDEMRGLAVLIEGDTIQSFLQHVADAEEAEEA